MLAFPKTPLLGCISDSDRRCRAALQTPGYPRTVPVVVQSRQASMKARIGRRWKFQARSEFATREYSAGRRPSRRSYRLELFPCPKPTRSLNLQDSFLGFLPHPFGCSTFFAFWIQRLVVAGCELLFELDKR